MDQGHVASQADTTLYSLSTTEKDPVSIILGRVPKALVALFLETSPWLLRHPLALSNFEQIYQRIGFCCVLLTAR